MAPFDPPPSSPGDAPGASPGAAPLLRPAARGHFVTGAGTAVTVLAAIGVGLLTGLQLMELVDKGLALTGTAAIATLAALLGTAYVFERQSKREAAEASEQHRLALIETLEASGAARMVCDAEGRILFRNALLDDLFGPAVTTLAEIEARFAAAPASCARLQQMRQRVAQGAVDRAEMLAPLPGHPRWLMVCADPGRQLSGLYLWRFEDITVRHEIDSVLRDERAKLTDLMDNAPVGFYAVDESGRFVFANATLAGWLGTTVNRLLESEVTLHHFLLSPPKGVRGCDIVENATAEQRAELMMRGENGPPFPASIAQSVVADEEQGGVRTRSVVRNLQPEREWQAALRASEQRFQRFFDSAPIGIALLDDGQKIAQHNPALAATFRRENESLAGAAFAALIEPARRTALGEYLDRVRSGEPTAGPLEIKTADREPRTVTVYASPFAAGGGGALVLHVIDATERIELEAQFVQSQKMQAIGQLAGGIAHDFNNLLTAMIGFCDLLLQRHKAGDPSFADIMQIHQNALRAANLVRQLLAFSRQQTLQPRVLDLTDVLTEVSHLLRRLIGEAIELAIVHERNLALVKADQGQIEQVLINLVVNARDAMAGMTGGKVTITTANVIVTSPVTMIGTETMPPGRYVKVCVADNGTGIARENLTRIFDPFFSTKAIGQGTGLGLSTVYGIVRQTGGFITVDSRPGEGAAFTIFLPALKDEETAVIAAGEAAKEPAPDLTGVGTILLVEDEDPVRMFAARALKNKGYRVLEAAGGALALELLEKHGQPIDLVITDVIMPQMDGPTLAAKVRERQPEVKLLFMSGYTEDQFRQHLHMEGNVHFLSKPFTLKQLAGKVKDVLQGVESAARGG
jgi:two-component system cell cycle sensor histidine kinase/response regulator CckA